MRMIILLIALGLAGAVAPASAAERIFADSFEPCCTLGGSVMGRTGSGLVLHLSVGTISEDKLIAAQGGALRLYTFSQNVLPGAIYVVSIKSQPAGQTCALINASGTLVGASISNVDVTCVGGSAGLVWDDVAWDDGDWQ